MQSKELWQVFLRSVSKEMAPSPPSELGTIWNN